MTKFFGSNMSNFDDDTFKLRFSEAIANLNPKSENAAYFYFIFCYRRIIAGLLIVFLPEYSYAQVMLYLFFN